jgi:hypothetical protein
MTNKSIRLTYFLGYFFESGVRLERPLSFINRTIPDSNAKGIKPVAASISGAFITPPQLLPWHLLPTPLLPLSPPAHAGAIADNKIIIKAIAIVCPVFILTSLCKKRTELYYSD